MKRLALVILAASTLVGCSATGGAFTVKTAVGVECKAQKPERPVFATEALRKGSDVDQYVRAARAERLQRDGYEEKLVAALDECIAPIAKP
ncbi:hypothetical protein C7T35_01495 [Variovorax sp. WS11]|uniref:hypothetical protein n=1 Tax=Variovorax sp. WS11 TaxID=1105204 RepID=UPI000D0E171A|nr:hypothetical protein [Variovorax sp. WS11]NDZ11472.1 hypothetical protein [Variovorax sp. WS11]PSL86669.1 hypothetical protein C7T35_01495 [Variovorax sp. WS11]